MEASITKVYPFNAEITAAPKADFTWRLQGNALIDLFRSICVFGKLPYNRLPGRVLATLFVSSQLDEMPAIRQDPSETIGYFNDTLDDNTSHLFSSNGFCVVQKRTATEISQGEKGL